MIRIVDGNLLNAEEQIMCHQVNAQAVMGSGLAAQLKNKYPVVYSEYRKLCDKTPNKKDLMGICQMIKVDSDKYVANLFGQYYYGRNKSIVYTKYDALEQSLVKLCEFARSNNLSVAIPYEIGAGLGNGDWNEIYNRIDKVFKDYEVALYRLKK